MTFKKQYVAARRCGWFLAPLLMVLTVSAMLLRERGSLYWGTFDSDLTSAFYPWRAFIHRWVVRGVFPFWDPHVFGGYPTIETQSMLSLNPLHLATLWLPPGLGLSMFALLHTLVACGGMAWALWRWGRCSAMAAALGAGLYLFGALFAVRIMAGHLTPIASIAWWPMASLSVLRIARGARGGAGAVMNGQGRSNARSWVALYVCSLKQFIRLPRLRRLVALSALVHAMVCLAGAPQYIVYLFYIDLAIVAAASRRQAWVPVLIVVAAVWVLALLLSAPQWLPALWYLPYSVRGIASAQSSGWSLQPLYHIWFETMLPFPFGDDMTHGHLHFKNVWETALYPGSIALVLTATLILRVGYWRLNRIIRRGHDGSGGITPLGLAGIMVAIMGVYMMAGGWLPGFDGFREPLKARAVVAFGFAVMAAAAFDGIARRPAAWRRFLMAGTALVFFLTAGASQYHNPQGFYSLVNGFGMPPFDPQAMPTYAAFLKDPGPAADRYFFAGAWALAGVFLTVLCLIKQSELPRVALTLLFLGALLDPFLAHAQSWMGRYSWSQNELPKPVAEYFAPRLAENKGKLPWRVVLDSGIINRTHHQDGLYEFHGYDPLMPAFAVGRMLVKGILNVPDTQRPQWRSNLLERVGVRYDARPGMGESTIGDAVSSGSLAVIVPGATLFDVSRNVVAGSPGSNLFGPDLNGTHYVLPANLGGHITDVPEVPSTFRTHIAELFPPDTGATSSTSAILPGETVEHLETGRPDEWGVRVNLTKPALVVYKGTWTPGWRVVVDGEDQGRALFANNWMSGAVSDAGLHEVVFRYRPVMWSASLWLSGLGVFCVAGLLLISRNGIKK